MSGESILIHKRTPEQDAAYFEARYTADRMSQKQRRDISEAEFGRIYGAYLRRQMMDAIAPLLKAKADYAALWPSPAMVVGPEGFWKFVQRAPTDIETLADEQIEAIKARYTQGLE